MAHRRLVHSAAIEGQTRILDRVADSSNCRLAVFESYGIRRQYVGAYPEGYLIASDALDSALEVKLAVGERAEIPLTLISLFCFRCLRHRGVNQTAVQWPSGLRFTSEFASSRGNQIELRTDQRLWAD
jgi:hypothetical protein